MEKRIKISHKKMIFKVEKIVQENKAKTSSLNSNMFWLDFGKSQNMKVLDLSFIFPEHLESFNSEQYWESYGPNTISRRSRKKYLVWGFPKI